MSSGTLSQTPHPTHDGLMSRVAIPTGAHLRRRVAMTFFAALTFATFFIVEHSLTMSLTSEQGDDAEFVDTDLDAGVESGSSLRKIGFLTFGGVGVLLLAFRGRPLNWGAVAPWAVAGFLLWIVASPLWAVDRSLCIRRVIVVAMMAGGIVAWIRMTTPTETVHWLGALVFAFLTLGFACELGLMQFRPWESGYRFGGTTHPNTLGVLAAMATFYATVRAQRHETKHQLLWYAIAAVTLVALVLTKSRTTLAATIVSLTVLWTLRAGWSQRLGIALTGTIAISATLLAALILNIDAVSGAVDTLLLGRAEEVTTLTGRTPLWAELNRDIAGSPFLGYGYGSFWTPEVLYRVKQNQGWQIPHAHSAYYETALNLGLIGLVIALIGVLGAWGRAVATDSRANIATGMTIATTTFAAVYSLTDTAFALPTFAAFALAVLVLQSSRLGTAAALPIDSHPGEPK